MAKLKLPFELEKPSASEFVTQASQIGYKGRNAEEALDEALDHSSDPEIESNTFYVTDSNGYVIAKIDKDGVHSVDFMVGEHGISLSEALGNVTGQITQAVNAEKLLREQGDASLTESLAVEENRAKSEEAKKLNAIINDNAFYFTDANGYIVAKIDASGVHSVNIEEEPNKIKNDSIVVTDNNGYIIFKIDANGVHAPNLSEGGEVNSNNITIQDKNGYIIARIDKDGIHSAKDKHAIACMVLSESYYPTAVPTRNSDGNVTYAKVMFETGVAGSLSITYTNGNSSSVAVVYGNYNYIITINRDSEGNVSTVSIN